MRGDGPSSFFGYPTDPCKQEGRKQNKTSSKMRSGQDTDAYDLRCWFSPAGQLCGCTASDEAALVPFQSAGAPGRGTPLSVAFCNAKADGAVMMKVCPVPTTTTGTAQPPPRGEPCPAGAVERVFRAEPTWTELDAAGCSILKLSPTTGDGAAWPDTSGAASFPGRYSYEPALPRYALRVNAN